MKNNITIKTLPVVLTKTQKGNRNWDMVKMIAEQDLECARLAILRDLEQNITIRFNFEVMLTLSINTTSFKIKIDYSEIKSRTAVKLVKLYLSGDIKTFATEWLKLG